MGRRLKWFPIVDYKSLSISIILQELISALLRIGHQWIGMCSTNIFLGLGPWFVSA